ncbi:Na+/H+ antiporter NhaC [Alteromonas sp. AMM-1]|uniref:Na+/H+ antiporter NhaC n=1 Tax=Alteromonas sp. AMM-1 TaxID=3394233 RepID=UPI0039A704A1
MTTRLSASNKALGWALLPIILTGAALMYVLFVLKGGPHIPLLLGCAITALIGVFRGIRWQEIQSAMITNIAESLPALGIFMLVGMTISSWIAAGTVPFLTVQGITMISPDWFLPATCLLCAVVSVFTGTSWGTVGTIGLALMGMAEVLGVSVALCAGAIVSGAWFGDKMSPLSDTTNFTAAIARVDLYKHIRNMIPSTLPAMCVSLVAYYWLGPDTSTSTFTASSLNLLSASIGQHFDLSWWVLLPPCVIGITIYFRLPAIPGIFFGVVAACLVAVWGQGVAPESLVQLLMNGFQSQTGQPGLDALLSKGGLMSMMWVISLIILAMALGGALQATGSLETLLLALLKVASTRFRLVLVTLLAALGFNFASNAFIAYTLPGRMLLPAYQQRGLSGANLSRLLEDGATMSAPLIPWNSGGVFVAGTLGVPTLLYAPFAFANWLAPLLDLLWAALNWFMPTSAVKQVR